MCRRAFQTLTLFETKTVHLASHQFLRQEILFHDSDSLRLAQEINFLNQFHGIRFYKLYIAGTIHADRASRTLTFFLRLSVQNDTIFKTLNSGCLPFMWGNRSVQGLGK